MEVILYSKECNWYTRCCLLNGGVRYRECPLRETILYLFLYSLKGTMSLLCFTYSQLLSPTPVLSYYCYWYNLFSKLVTVKCY